MRDFGADWREEVQAGREWGYPGPGAVLTFDQGSVDWVSSAPMLRVCVVTSRRENGRDRMTFERDWRLGDGHPVPDCSPPGVDQGWYPWEWETRQ